MLASVASKLNLGRVASCASSRTHLARKSGRSVSKPNLMLRANIPRRSYALMRYDDPYVASDYGTAPQHTIPAILRDSLSDRGKTYSAAIRSEHELIPAVLNRREDGKPMLLLVDPEVIFAIMHNAGSRFLGRRYFLDVQGLESYEVIPQHLDVEAIGYYPKAVGFATYDPKKLPKPRLPPHVHRKFFEPLQEYPSLEEQKQQRLEGTYVYKRFLRKGISAQKGPKLL